MPFDDKFSSENLDLECHLDFAYEAIRLETRKAVQDLLANKVLPRHPISITRPIAGHIGATGLIGMMIPAAYGGRGQDCLARLVSIEEAARLSSDLGAFLQIAQLGSMALLEFGTPEQKETWLPILADGQRICTIAITEEQSGSHIRGCQTNYQSVGKDFLLNGEKWFIGNAPIADLHVVLARDAETGQFSALLVDGRSPGVDNSHRQETFGLRGFPFGKVTFRDVAIPSANVIGEIGMGQEVARRIIERHGRLSLTGLALGIHQRIYECVVAHANMRQLYGKSLITIPDIKRKIFDIYNSLEQGRSIAYRAADLERRGRNSGKLLSLAKRTNSENVCKSALTALDIFGARGNLTDYPIAQLLMDAIMTLSPSGTSDIVQKRVLQDLFDKKTMTW